MTLMPEQRKFLIEERIKKARKSMRSAENVVTSEPGLSARASYDCAFHILVGLFLCDGIRVPATHKGVNERFYEIYVRGEDAIPGGIASILGELETDRNIDTYSSKIEEQLTIEDSEKDLAMAKKFFTVVNALIEERINKLDLGDKQEHAPNEALITEVLALGLIEHKGKESPPKIYTKTRDLVEYHGKILHVGDVYSVQQIGKISLVVHMHDNLERIPQASEVVKITYRKNEKAAVRPSDRENKRNQEQSR